MPSAVIRLSMAGERERKRQKFIHHKANNQCYKQNELVAGCQGENSHLAGRPCIRFVLICIKLLSFRFYCTILVLLYSVFLNCIFLCMYIPCGVTINDDDDDDNLLN